MIYPEMARDKWTLEEGGGMSKKLPLPLIEKKSVKPNQKIIKDEIRPKAIGKLDPVHLSLGLREGGRGL